MGNGSAAEIEQRLNEGAWLRPGEVAVLFGKSRWTVINWIKNGYKAGGERITLHYHETGGGHRELDPDDVKRALAAYRTRRSDTAAD